ncbi:MAG TPA: hypothetical protein VFU82_07085 [Gammaproteobacteria bacterium]|jgi:hypothetical protein|nr:hypothetical protein [Gammaproteobacteria bacterium]
MEKVDYKEKLFDVISTAIEETGKEDTAYTDAEKALDILDVLESLLAYTIYTTCDSDDTIRDSAEESYINIKKRALMMLKNEQTPE